MIVSEARLAANRQNSTRSTGPSSVSGQETSRRNSLKHGLSGKGIVTPEGDAEEIRARIEALTADMKPISAAGVLLIAQMATLSLRAERAAEQESAAIARNIRHAADDFDEERIELANALFEALAEDPRNVLRKLRKSPEGVERLVDAWRDLRNDLTADPEPAWTASHLEQAANLTGLKSQHARGSRLGALSKGFWGDFLSLKELDGDLDEGFRREWAKSMLLERIDGEIAALEAHYQTLDFEMIELDRAEAGQRALFDSSKPAALARRYESEARNGFFKALKEFRKVEAEAAAQAQANPTPPKAVGTGSGMGSFREMPPPPDREPVRAIPAAPMPEFSTLRDADGQSSVNIRSDKAPG